MGIPEEAMSGEYPAREENKIETLVDGERAFDEIFSAVMSAKTRVWLTMSFADINCKVPVVNGETGKSIIDILTQVSGKGVDVRVLAWRSDTRGDFQGDRLEREKLRYSQCKAKFRWDVKPVGCHHQKTFIIDSNIAFVGGINMEQAYMDNKAHNREKIQATHDLFCKIEGPSARDVAHNFVQRWNGFSERGQRNGSFPGEKDVGDLEMPKEEDFTPQSGGVKSQITRTIPEEVYDSIPYGEFGIRESYLNAIMAATDFIYIENQYFFEEETHHSVIRELVKAAYRGVKVFLLVPGWPDKSRVLSFEYLNEVKDHPNIYVYTLATSAKKLEEWEYNEVYIHAKLFIVDDEWLSIGSANISLQSLRTDSEMNVAVWSPDHAKKLRLELWEEHLEYEKNKDDPNYKVIFDGKEMGPKFEQWWHISRENRYYRETGSGAKSRVFPLDLSTYRLFRMLSLDTDEKLSEAKKGAVGVMGAIIEKVNKIL
ncbi:MAG: phosphatidylserine/phosphatidylglycerophosphate/cardiolipin synthase family protein [Gammaproteobacteria bacterium]|nr:phosphatidylserine/phosphatidylglycerophosphate/cardiolipin synthase family protein [Gammaproteobacteria bacterium]